MHQVLKIIIYITILYVFLIGLLIGQRIVIPITFLLILGIMYIDIYITKMKIQKGIYFKFGVNHEADGLRVISGISGFLLMFIGVFIFPFLTWNGLGIFFFIGLFSLVNLIKINGLDFKFLLKPNSIYFTKFMVIGECKYDDIVNVVIHNKNIQLISKSRKVDIDLEDEKEIEVFKNYISQKINDKLIIK